MRVVEEMEVPVGQVNFMGSLPCSASNVLEPMSAIATASFRNSFKELKGNLGKNKS